MTTVYLIRHAEAEGNVFRRFHGQYDSLLTPRGKAQVACLQARFANVAVDACYASDLTRTCMTAKAIYEPKGLPLRRDARFREVAVGRWEDIPFAYLDLHEQQSRWLFDYDPENWHISGAESYDSCVERMLEGLLDMSQAHDGQTVAIFSHGAITRWLLVKLFFGGDFKKLRFGDNTAVTKLLVDNGQIQCEYINDQSHLPAELSSFHLQQWWRALGDRSLAAVYFRLLSQDERSVRIAAVLKDTPVGELVLATPSNGIGTVLSMGLDEGYQGRFYADQMLGEAVSRFRSQGCRQLRLAPGEFPDDIFARYGFSESDRSIGIAVSEGF